MPKQYIVEDGTNEFRELEEGEEAGDNLVLEEDEVELISGSCGDIEAVFAYKEGKETRFGVVHEGKLLVSANLSHSCVTAVLNLFGRRHNENQLDQ